MYKNNDITVGEIWMNEGIIGLIESKITYENKLIFGIFILIVGFLVWGYSVTNFGERWEISPVIIFIMAIPSILLIIPNESIKNSKVLAILLGLVTLAFIGSGFYGLLTLEEFSRGEAAFDALRFFILGFDENALYEMIFEQGLEHYLLVIFYPLLNLICCFMMYIETPKTENSDVVPDGGRYCSNCGAYVVEDSNFCDECGQELE